MRTRRLAVDAGWALALLVFCVAGTLRLSGGQPWAAALAGVAAASLALRRVWPLVTLAVSVGATSVYLALGFPYGPVLLTVLIAGYSVARQLAVRTALISAVVAAPAVAAHAFVTVTGVPRMVAILFSSTWIAVAFAAGISLRLRAESLARDRVEWARRTADEERLRVAQEVHDVVGHGLSAIAMQADVALHVLPRQPEQAAAALAAISRTSKDALEELRVTLAMVRREPDDRAPLPGLARLDAMAARTTQSGLPVRVEIVGTARTLPATVDLAAYRIVQESLTNTLRHAGPATVVVTVRYEDAGVSVDVSDTGRGGTSEPGQGIAGMRRRAESLGGSFTAGPGGQGGFRVAAWIPAP